ncbi:MAG: thioredoxin family protein [Anaerolineales bacterium]|nr:thioredoxin family protein [Anaerolineales bacterium]
MKFFLDSLLHNRRTAGWARAARAVSISGAVLGLLLTVRGTAAAAPVPIPPAEAARVQSNDPVYIYLFWGEGCPHCAQAKPFLESLAQRDSRIVLRSYEVYYNPANHEIFAAVCRNGGIEARYVPTILVGIRYWEGFSEQIAYEIQNAVSVCLQNGCPDAGAGVVAPLPTAVPTAAPEPGGQSSDPNGNPGTDTSTNTITLPLIGTIELTGKSLALTTALIAFVDSFNPCSLWVLTMLLTLTLHTGSRRKVLVIGVVFLTITAVIYGLFIAGLFTVFTIVSFTGWIQVIVSLVALVFGLVNLKDYFWYKEGVSFTISDSKKPGIFERMRNLMDPNLSFGSLLGGTVVLAAGTSLVEFSCTAGFPVIWTNMLVSQNAGTLTFILLLLLYLVVYQVEAYFIFAGAVLSLQSSRIEEKHGRLLKLVGGMLMLTLAAVMLIRPSLMNDLGSSLLIFGIALAAVLLVLVLHRTILPRMGIRIGSEFSGKRGRHSRRKASRR